MGCGDFNSQARAGIQELHFLPFNPTDKRTALTYLDREGKMHRVSKGAPEQEVPEGRKESAGGPWQFIGLLPLFDPPRHDSAETIRRALNLGVNVKMITGALSLYFLLSVYTSYKRLIWRDTIKIFSA
ncbi:hypothetical protein POM88_038931 [Heracleum sosnowskyi]|uniref:Uncharacterized protein n=1 Tax=Heracleum sosnowskyi TaxID=360622 RepID=A0AAD8HC76_9APIA|nr:hypothetical protein POM88_038931 [Heracleum sosnowskyi]